VSAFVKSKVEAATGWSRIGRQLPRLALASAAFAVASCLMAAPNAGAGSAAGAQSLRREPDPAIAVVIVTLDGVRWNEVFEGVDPALAKAHGMSESDVVSAAELMPNLHAMIDSRGVALGAPGHGAAIRASGPNFVSLPGYAEILSGRRSTACHDNQCAGSGSATVVDQLAATSSVEHPDVAVITSWADIARVASDGTRGAAVSSGRHGGATRGWFSHDAQDRALLLRAEDAAPAPGNGDFRPDAMTADLALQHLKTHATRFLFLGLGEPDEYGHQGNYAGYLASLRQADARIAEVDAELQRLAARGTRTALFITADHGRADTFAEHGAKFPESARVWLVASGSALKSSGYQCAPRERRLADLAPTVRQIAGLPKDTDPAAGTPLFEMLRADSDRPTQ
jgi:Metalloenzyme superfamily